MDVWLIFKGSENSEHNELSSPMIPEAATLDWMICLVKVYFAKETSISFNLCTKLAGSSRCPPSASMA